MAQPIDIPDCAKQLLRFLYPTVDWSRVTFYSGLPWWVASGTLAITIPDPIGALGYRVYLGDNTDFCNDATLNVIVHESFHLQQFMADGGGYGVGFLRSGFLGYFICFVANGFSYAANPFEIEAYAQEDAFAKCHTIPVCDCASGKPVFNPAALDALVRCNPSLVVREAHRPSCASWWSVPVGLLLLGILAILAFIVSLIDLFDCTYLQTQSQQCIQWGQTRRQECQQWADQGYSQCSQWADHGYSACSQWADQGYNSCCDWWPCSWVCGALVWISHWVCVLTVWVSNWVCLASVWVAHWVCIIAVTILEWTCVATMWVFRTIFFCWLR